MKSQTKKLLFIMLDTWHYTTNSVKSLYLIINKINGYIKERNPNKELTLVTTDKSKTTLKTYE